MKAINRRKALVVTGAGIAAALTASPALAGQSELESLIATYEVARADYDKVYDEFAVVEREYFQWKKTAPPRLVQFLPNGKGVDALEGYDEGLVVIEPISRDIRDRLAGMFSGQELKTILAMVEKQEQDICDLLEKECKALKRLPVVANYNRVERKENAALHALIDAQCAVCGYPTRTMADVHVKAAWLRRKYQGRSADFMDEEADALLQSFFDLGR